MQKIRSYHLTKINDKIEFWDNNAEFDLSKESKQENQFIFINEKISP